MINWKIVKVKFTKELDDGTVKRVTEPYLISAQSFTESEARVYKEVGEFVRGEFEVTGITNCDYTEIYDYDDAEDWYKCQVAYVSEDADSGKEKKIKNNYLIKAHNVKEAYERIVECLSGLMVSFEIPKIELTKIVEVFSFTTNETDDFLI